MDDHSSTRSSTNQRTRSRSYDVTTKFASFVGRPSAPPSSWVFRRLLMILFGIGLTLPAFVASAAGQMVWSASLNIGGGLIAYTTQTYPTKAQAIAAMRALPSPNTNSISTALLAQLASVLVESTINQVVRGARHWRWPTTVSTFKSSICEPDQPPGPHIHMWRFGRANNGTPF